MSGNHDGLAMAIQMGLDKHSIGYVGHSKETFLCEICLWTFKTETELAIHNYLEHLIMKRDDIRNNYEDG